MSFTLHGKTALVTGASRGIGRSIALTFAAAGADVALVARDTASLAEVAQEVEGHGRRAIVKSADVTDPEGFRAEIGAAITELGRLDILVNNAGGNSFSLPLVMTRFSGWDKTMKLNLDSIVHACQVALPHMLETGSGSVINMSSVIALRGAPLMAHYAAAKAAVVSLTQSLALECAASGVRVNALLPGWIETDLTGFLRKSEDTERSVLQRVPMQRWGRPEEIAAAAQFLASDAGSFVTGHALVVDGGLSVMP
ncbi:MAG: SDR family NAD(P)-dependent oxidoreductase [Candidatus Nanopelagicales bacterium]|nr:SDR family NAD(P)-dependent oxidoreductase [Candidatus Nanopelagicales bacterium]MDZ4249860.1 SDR family NAD(P)-dependent oxidoreductase [Candidatus Nanopelagicales bacterium]